MPVQNLKIVYRDPRKLVGYENNARVHSPEQVKAIRASQDKFGFTNPILLRDDDATIGAGHGRHEAAMLAPMIKRVPTITLHGLSDAEWRAYVIADNKLAEDATWDFDKLRTELDALASLDFDLSSLSLSLDSFAGLPGGNSTATPGSLAATFGVPPFSVLNAREGWWQDRKASWIAIGIQSELGRGGDGAQGEGSKAFKNQDALTAVGRRKANSIPGGGANAAGPRQGG